MQVYLITYGYDIGGPEDGPIFRKGEDIFYADSVEDAEKRWGAEYGDGTEGYWARLATPEEVETWERENKEYNEWLEGWLELMGDSGKEVI